MVEVLRHTGLRIEELTELSHHSLIQYRLPTSGELVPLLQIAPSKTDQERLLYDAALGRLSATEIKYTAPDAPGDATLYAVVHDDRDGVTWLQVNVHAR